LKAEFNLPFLKAKFNLHFLKAEFNLYFFESQVQSTCTLLVRQSTLFESLHLKVAVASTAEWIRLRSPLTKWS